ncbi:MAG: GEVED domain-containing protein [Armatimonadetes bacterium]|nr:GEVED domain-containing protein [Armatimonadota bacterium]
MENRRNRSISVCLRVALCAALVLSFGTAATAVWQPYFFIDSLPEWDEAMGLGRIKPMTEAQWGDYMHQWETYPVEGQPYPPTRFMLPELYVWGGGGGGGLYPEDAGLVMVWNGSDDPAVKYSSAWLYDYGPDPDLSNSTITLTVTAPQWSTTPPTSQVNNVSFGIQDINGNVRSWHWTCGPSPNPIQWNTSTTITINTSIAGVTAANPVATGYVNSPAFNIVNSQNFIVDENGTWVGSSQPVPPPGQTLPAMWNYWHNISVAPNQPVKGQDPTKWSQPPDFLSLGPGNPIINGWDERSMYREGPPIVADDWECKDERPVTDFHWWGSFIGWTQPYPPVLPNAFHLAIWTDVASNPPEIPFSHPGRMVWEHYCYDYTWNFAGYDKDPRGLVENEACFQFNQWLRPEHYFYQEPGPDGRNVYWLSIAAVYDEITTLYPWGWKTRPHHFNDDAVRIYQVIDTAGNTHWPPVLGSIWDQGEEIRLGEESWDLAFELTTIESGMPYNDLGDAPDRTNSMGAIMTAYPPGGPPGVIANYPTVYAGPAPNGPLHLKPQAVAYLGPAVTLENDADTLPDQDPTTNILPMLDQPDQDVADDGVIFPIALPNCQSTTFQYLVNVVIPNQQLYANVWFDWNRDGDWDDTLQCATAAAPEWAVQNQPLIFAAPGLYTVTSLPFLPWQPHDALVPIWMRITLSEQKWQPFSTLLGYGGSGPAAGYQFGETEDYYFWPLNQQEPQDFGDAPDSYITKLPNGARHMIAPGMMMGNAIDAEGDGQPNANATGDDLAGFPDDEDGVTISKLAQGCPGAAKVSVTLPGRIDAWIDWANDGTFATPGDQIAVSTAVVPGVNTLKFLVPAAASLGDTFARFRYSSAGGLSYMGFAGDGEVEDYMVRINPTPFIVNKGRAKLLPLDTDVLIQKDVVTANFGVLGWYFEEPERTIGPAKIGGRFAGLGVMGEEPWAINDMVTCYGRTVLSGCELMLDEYASMLEGSGSITPLGQTNKGSGGGPFGNQPGLMDIISGVGIPRPAYGLNSVGLLVRLWGRCTCIEETTGGPVPIQTNFWIDDGSNLWDGTMCPIIDKPALGVKVRVPDGYAGPPIVGGAYYCVTGIMRTTGTPVLDCARWLWPRMDTDVQLIPVPM